MLEDFVFYLNEHLFDIKKASNSRIYVEIMILKFINEKILDKSEEQIISREIICKQTFDNETVVSKNDFLEEEKSENISISLKENFDNDNSYDKIENDFLQKYKNLMDIRVNNTLCKADKNVLLSVKKNMEKLKVMTIIGTRPEIIRLSAVIKCADKYSIL